MITDTRTNTTDIVKVAAPLQSLLQSLLPLINSLHFSSFVVSAYPIKRFEAFEVFSVGFVGASVGLVGASVGLVGVSVGLVGASVGLVGASDGLVGASDGLVGASDGLVGLGVVLQQISHKSSAAAALIEVREAAKTQSRKGIFIVVSKMKADVLCLGFSGDTPH